MLLRVDLEGRETAGMFPHILHFNKKQSLKRQGYAACDVKKMRRHKTFLLAYLSENFQHETKT